MECKEEGCVNPVQARGWCTMHYARWKKYGDPGPADRLRRKNGEGTGCWAKGCMRAPEKAGLCGRHYQRRRMKGAPEGYGAPAEDGWPACKIDGCEAAAVGRGWCSMHWQRWKKTGDPGPAEPKRYRWRHPAGTICVVEDCTQAARFSDKCRRHYQQEASRRDLLKSYGLTLEDYERMVARQRSRCAVCRRKRPASDKREWAIDHDHVTGQIRGLLCDRCNRAIGLLRDEPKILRAAVQYVERHRQLLLIGPRKAG